MSALEKPDVTIDNEDIYSLLVDIQKQLLDQKVVLDQVSSLLAQIPQAMEQLNSNPMFKPFAKMLGLGG
jgi:signal recognition particle GTPase